MGSAYRPRSCSEETRVGTAIWFAPDRVTAEPSVARLYGLDPEAATKGVSGAEAMHAVHPDDVVPARQIIKDHMRSGEFLALRYRVCPRPGELHWVLVQGQVVQDEVGSPLRFPTLICNVSDTVESGDAMEALGNHLLEAHKLASELELKTSALATALALDDWFREKRAQLN